MTPPEGRRIRVPVVAGHRRPDRSPAHPHADAPADSAADVGSSAKRALDLALKYAVPLTGLLGALLYGVLRLAYVFFYLHLRTTPEEVGYGYVEILAGQLIGTLELVIILALLLIALLMAAEGVRRLIQRRRPAVREVFLDAVIRGSVSAVVLVVVGLLIGAGLEGRQAAAGFTVRNVYLRWTFELPVLAVQAVPATVSWISTPADGFAEEISRRRCLLYLGRSDAISTFYDVSSRESLRIASSSIVVSLRNEQQVPAGC